MIEIVKSQPTKTIELGNQKNPITDEILTNAIGLDIQALGFSLIQDDLLLEDVSPDRLCLQITIP